MLPVYWLVLILRGWGLCAVTAFSASGQHAKALSRPLILFWA